MCLSKLESMNLEVICDLEEVVDEHYYLLNDDKVQQWESSKVNALLYFKFNDLDTGTQFTCFTGTKVAEGLGYSVYHPTRKPKPSGLRFFSFLET